MTVTVTQPYTSTEQNDLLNHIAFISFFYSRGLFAVEIC